MTIVGVGTDLVDLDRFRLVLHRTPSIVDRLFTDAEQRYARGRRDPTERFGARFAAKEAVLKALGLGLGSVGFREIEVVRAESGEPSLVLHGRAARAADERGVGRWLLSLSHTAGIAHAIVMALPRDPAGDPS
jgi:holo-[acyl-carrier protein] synthase